MREYENVFVLHPKVDDAGIEREITAVKEVITAGDGEMVGVHKWGRRKLAYPIRKVNEGFYVIMRFKSEPEVLTELDRKFKLNESVLRHLTVVAQDDTWPPDLRGRERRGPRGDRGGPPVRDRRGGVPVRPRPRTEEETLAPAEKAPADESGSGS